MNAALEALPHVDSPHMRAAWDYLREAKQNGLGDDVGWAVKCVSAPGREPAKALRKPSSGGLLIINVAKITEQTLRATIFRAIAEMDGRSSRAAATPHPVTVQRSAPLTPELEAVLSRRPDNWLDAGFFDQQMEDSQRNSESYETLRPVEETTIRTNIVWQGLTQARAAGLVFPPVTLTFVSAGEGRTRGQAVQARDGSLKLFINVDETVNPQDLRAVVFHEAMHFHDMKAGVFDRMPVAESERRAVNFSHEMMRRFPW